MNHDLVITGAREHNLKDISLSLPRDRFIVITGLSGSGKSSLAFDTIYAEGQRRYVESLSAYARQFLGQMDKPDVDSIEGLSPAISIDQKTTSRNPRSTVGTVTEIYDYLRLLYARVGHPHCPICGRPIAGQSIQQIVDQAGFGGCRCRRAGLDHGRGWFGGRCRDRRRRRYRGRCHRLGGGGGRQHRRDGGGTGPCRHHRRCCGHGRLCCAGRYCGSADGKVDTGLGFTGGCTRRGSRSQLAQLADVARQFCHARSGVLCFTLFCQCILRSDPGVFTLHGAF